MRPTADPPLDPVQRVRHHLVRRDDFAVTSEAVGDHNCRLILDIDSVCIDCDASRAFHGPDVVRPDFLIASADANGRFVWVVVEMSTGQKRASVAHRQLRAGIDVLSRSSIPTPANARLAAIVMIPRDLSVADLQTLALPKYRLVYAKRPVLPRLGTCGEALSKTIKTSFRT